MMPIDPSIRIPKDILLPIALETRKRLPCDPVNWNDYEIEVVRQQCGPEYACVPIQNVRNQCENLRKSGKLGRVRVGGHGATKRDPMPTWYQDYLKTEHWQTFRRQILEFWDWRCALCNGNKKMDVHHRTYDRLHKESINDCVALCRECHNAAHRAFKRNMENVAAESAALIS